MNMYDEDNVNGKAINSTNTGNNEMRQETSPQSHSEQAPKERKTRRTKAKIEEEYKMFKELYDNGCSILEILSKMKLTKAQSATYLNRISSENIKKFLIRGVCEGYNLPDTICKMLEGSKADLYKYERRPDGVLLTIFHRKN